MKRAILVLVLLMGTLGLIADEKLFQITLEKNSYTGMNVLNFEFLDKIPPPGLVDKIIKSNLENMVSIYPEKDILAMAFDKNDTALNSNQCSGHMIYKADAKRIMTWAEYEESTGQTKTTVADRNSYHLEIQEEKTCEGIIPVKKWINIRLVYEASPNTEKIYNDMIFEIKKLAEKGLDINAYAYIGDKDNKTSWVQIKDSNGKYAFMAYAFSSKTLRKQGSKLNIISLKDIK